MGGVWIPGWATDFRVKEKGDVHTRLGRGTLRSFGIFVYIFGSDLTQLGVDYVALKRGKSIH